MRYKRNNNSTRYFNDHHSISRTLNESYSTRIYIFNTRVYLYFYFRLEINSQTFPNRSNICHKFEGDRISRISNTLDHRYTLSVSLNCTLIHKVVEV